MIARVLRVCLQSSNVFIYPYFCDWQEAVEGMGGDDDQSDHEDRDDHQSEHSDQDQVDNEGGKQDQGLSVK